jgi:hypothetical protein
LNYKLKKKYSCIVQGVFSCQHWQIYEYCNGGKKSEVRLTSQFEKSGNGSVKIQFPPPHRPTNGQSRKTNFNSPKTTEIDQQRNKATSTYQLTTPISQPPIVPNFHHVKPRSKKSESLKHIFRSHCLLILKYPPSHIYLPINSNVISFKKISIGAKDQTRKRIERMEAEREERRRLMQEVSIALKKL